MLGETNVALPQTKQIFIPQALLVSFIVYYNNAFEFQVGKYLTARM